MADEWGGLPAFTYTSALANSHLTLEPTRHIPTGSYGRDIQLYGGRLYVAAQGGGIWSADAADPSNGSLWKWSTWATDPGQWPTNSVATYPRPTPQPYPVTALAVHKYNEEPNTYIFAIGHTKKYQWSESDKKMLLYRESPDSLIQERGVCDLPVADGGYSYQDVVWPDHSNSLLVGPDYKPDIVYVAAHDDAVHAYVVNPDADPDAGPETPQVLTPSTSALNLPGNKVSAMRWMSSEDRGGFGYLVLGLEPGVHLYSLSYPSPLPGSPGFFQPPDRNNTDLSIEFGLFDGQTQHGLTAAVDRKVFYMDVARIVGLKDGEDVEKDVIAMTTDDGLAIFYRDSFSADKQPNLSWDKIKIPALSLPGGRTLDFTDVALSSDPDKSGSSVAESGAVMFDRQDPQFLYIVDANEDLSEHNHPTGLWCLKIDTDWTWQDTDPVRQAHLYRPNVTVEGYYPSTHYFAKTSDYEKLSGLSNWPDPDVPSLHDPRTMHAEGGTVFVTGWGGKIQKVCRGSCL